MNHTAAIREYCKKHEGTIIDAAFINEHFFPLIEYRTLLKILERLSDGGILTKVSKGVYLACNKADAENIDIDAKIRNFYVGDTEGVEIGYTLYNKLGLSDYTSKKVEAYTRRLVNGKHKHVRNFYFTGANLFFDYHVKDLIFLLEIVEKRKSIVDIDYMAYDRARRELAILCEPNMLEHVTRAIAYQRGSISIVSDLIGNKRQQ